MKIKMIDVLTSIKAHAIDICMLVDKLEFLREIDRLRKKWQITKLYIPRSLLGGDELLDTHNLLFYTDLDQNEKKLRLPEFNQDIDNVLKTFNRGKNFKLVVEYALIIGIIPEGVYQSCYFDVVTINEPEDLSKPEKYQYVIVVSPRTEKKEVEKAFEEFQKHIEGKIKFESRTLPKLQETGNLITDQEIKELNEQATLIEIKHKQYIEKIKNVPVAEAVKEYSKFVKQTKSMREKYESFKHKLPLDVDSPDDLNLIEQYHRANIFDSAIINDGNRRDLERTREWYWIRFGGYLNDDLKDPKTYEEMAEEWKRKCPRYPTDNDKKHDKSCLYCRVDGSYFAHTLSPYEKLLEQ